MSRKFCQAFVAAMIGGMILSTVDAETQSPTDDTGSCESSSLDESETLIRIDLKDVKLVRKELKNVKSLLGSIHQQTNNASKQDLEDVKSLLKYIKQQNNNVSCVSKKDLEDLKAVCASNQQQRPTTMELPDSRQVFPCSLIGEYRIHVIFVLSICSLIAGTDIMPNTLLLQYHIILYDITAVTKPLAKITGNGEFRPMIAYLEKPFNRF